MVANAGIAVYKPLLERQYAHLFRTSLIHHTSPSLLTKVSTVPVEEFDSVVAVNLRGAMLCYKYAAQQMVKQGRGGRIIGPYWCFSSFHLDLSIFREFGLGIMWLRG